MGNARKNHKYISRIGVPGAYRYFYTYNALDAYMKKHDSKIINNANKINYKAGRILANRSRNTRDAVERFDRFTGAHGPKLIGAEKDKSFQKIKRLTGFASMKKKAEKFVSDFMGKVITSETTVTRVYSDFGPITKG